jgi:hypothetical protein
MMDIKESDQILYLINYGRDLEREVKNRIPLGFLLLFFIAGYYFHEFLDWFWWML